jgi:hypothetical protein
MIPFLESSKYRREYTGRESDYFKNRGGVCCIMPGQQENGTTVVFSSDMDMWKIHPMSGIDHHPDVGHL